MNVVNIVTSAIVIVADIIVIVMIIKERVK